MTRVRIDLFERVGMVAALGGMAALVATSIIAGYNGTTRGRLASPRSVGGEYYLPLDVSRVIDGDTIVGAVTLPYGVALPHVTIRAADYDAWEASRARRTVEVDDVELARGERAKLALELLATGPMWVRPPAGRQRDSYGRLLGELYAGDPPAAVRTTMQAGGHVRPAIKSGATE